MMGSQGLKDATSIAILSANYMATRLGNSFPVVYTGSKAASRMNASLIFVAFRMPAGLPMRILQKG